MSDNAEVLLRVEHLCQYFRENKAVNDVSFDIKRGEVFGLVGESGCGKTTTGRAIIRLYNATSGNVWFKGHRIVAGTLSYRKNIKAEKEAFKNRINELKLKMKEDSTQSAYYTSLMNEATKKFDETVSKEYENIRLAKRDQKYCDKIYEDDRTREVVDKYTSLLASAKPEEVADIKKEYDIELKAAATTRLTTQIQMIFQDPTASIDPRMTVREIIAEGLTIRGIKDKKVIDDMVYSVLERVGLVREHAGRYPHEFSGGQKQRIGVARAVIMKPELIIADEPVSALDVSIQAQVINLLNDLRHELGLTILFIAHDLSVVKYFSDRIGVMYYGNMVELASSDELFAHPLHPYTRSLLSAIPLPDPRFEKTRKRITYNPLAEHDYTTDQPSFREVCPGHFVRCNNAEYEKYVKELGL